MNNISIPSRLTRKAFFCLCLFLFSLSTYAQLPNGFIDAKSQGGYASPMGVIFSKNGQKMFIWEKKGTLWVSNWNGSTYVKQASVVLDISEEVADWRDFGFQSVALDPNFDSNGLIYMYYQVDRHHLLNFGTPQYNSATNAYFNASISRLTRYKINNNSGTLTADNASRKVLLGETKSTGVPLTHESHAGGQIVFGNDGTLFVTTGDNASYASNDIGSAGETYFQQAINDGIIRTTENVGAFRSQMINSFCGKLLRMDPNTGDGIPSNPHYDGANPRSAKSRLWAMGLRNPYRCSFKTGTGSTNPSDGNPGTVIIADVQNGTWEDMHIVEKSGVNCGWPLYEGIESQGGYYNSGAKNLEEAGQPTFQSLCVQPNSAAINGDPKQRRFTHLPPAIDWRHGQNIARYPDYSSGNLQAKTIGSAGAHVIGTPFGGNCATSGTYYTGTAFPANYRNVYFFADYGANWIKAAVLHDNSDHQIHEVKDFAPAGYGKGIVDIEYCPLDGSIFYVNINTGDIQKISFGGNRPPIVAISSDKTAGTSSLAVNFSSSGSNDPDGNPITYEWNFGDGSANSTVANPSHTFSATGTKGFTVTLTVRDNQGLSDSKTLVISVNNTAPSVKITNPVNNAQYVLTGPTQYNLQSNVTDNDASGMQYAWQVTLRHNNHEHREPVINQQSPTVQISPVGCDGETYYYLIEVKITDNGGLTARDSVKVYPNCNAQNLNITGLSATAQTNAVALKWTNSVTAFDEVMVVAKDGSGFITNPSGTSYTANANFTSNGTAFEGGTVVYKGTGTGVTVTGLTSGRKYYFRVFTRKSTTWTGGVETSATPTGTTPLTQQLGCLKGSYFNNITLSGTPSVIRPESSINYSWGTGAPVSGINADNFSVRWEGIVIPSISGTYTFSITGDDGIRLWVNNQLIVDKWFDQGPTTYTANINLTQSQNIPIKVEYYERGGDATAKLLWTVPNQASKVTAFNACPISTTSFDPTKCYRFTARHSGKVMDNAGNTAVDGAKILQYGWDGTKSQVWHIKSVDGTYFRIMNGNSGKALNVPNSSQADGAALQQYTYGGSANQQFKFEAANGYYFISARHSGKYLDVFGGSTADGTAIIQWSKNGGNNQQWQVNEVGCPAGTIPLLSSQIYSADGYREGRKGIVTWVSNATDADYFIVEKLDKNGDFEKLDVVNAKPVNDISVKNYYSYTDNQTFDGENTYRITLVTDNTPLSVPNTFGMVQYSNLVSLNFKTFMDFTLFPNPAHDYIDVDLIPYQDRSVLMTVIDALGREVRFSSVERAGKVHRIVLEGLTSGQYMLRIQTVGKRDVTRLFNVAR